MIELSTNAVSHIRKFAHENPEDIRGKSFRIYVEGGGCSGFQYGYTFDEAKADDETFTFDGVTLLVDPMSAQFLQGSVVDYVDDLRGAGFMVKNPNASTTCSCGHSFSV